MIWFNESISLSNIISNISSPFTVFVTGVGDIYANLYNSQVSKWTLNTTTSIPVMSVLGACYGLFVDISNTLYCSLRDNHQVVKKWLDDGMLISAIVAGTGYASSTSYTLSLPCGIFVDINFDLYVADCGNNRVQLFHLGQLSASTIAGTGSPDIMTLSCPTAVVLDADKYLFIVDNGNNRIIGQGPIGFRCVVGCFGSGPAPNQLNNPQSMSFDSYGNIFVVDTTNNRIQKFVLATNSCGKY